MQPASAGGERQHRPWARVSYRERVRQSFRPAPPYRSVWHPVSLESRDAHATTLRLGANTSCQNEFRVFRRVK